ncbi:MAG: hypothetical protein G8D61_00020 [gamma proteobacterium symbiont of Ctena orbiculata]|nr:hypothetical protein [Candidatus Thiodiazotropha taylori]MBV2096392.1 hypothetical protein [Candidatus Thiodiazotropha sp. (ex Codakia orbicularis)]
MEKIIIYADRLHGIAKGFQDLKIEVEEEKREGREAHLPDIGHMFYVKTGYFHLNALAPGTM